MSHCTKFDFQYTDEKCVQKTFENLGLSWQESLVRTSDNLKWRVDEYPSFRTYSPSRSAYVAKKNGFNYFMENVGNHFELSVEKHEMSKGEAYYATQLENEFRRQYIKTVAQLVIEKMENNGNNCLLDETDKGFSIHFGSLYEKSILVKFDNGRVIEEVQGVKGASCTSLTEALENMLSSPDVELNSEWTEEYYDDSEDGLTVYNMEKL